MSAARSEVETKHGNDTRGDVLGVLLLGANTWLVTFGWAAWTVREEEPWSWGVGGLCLLLLAVGGWLHGRPTRLPNPSAWLWLFGVPVTLTVAVALVHHGTLRHTTDAVGSVIALLSLCAYGAAAVNATEPKPNFGAHELSPLSTIEPDHAARTALRRGLAAVCVTAAVVFTAVLPSMGDGSALEQAWGDAARQGHVLVTVVGAALAVSVVSVFLPSALRSQARSPEPRMDATLRTTWFLFLALLGAVTYYVVQP